MTRADIENDVPAHIEDLYRHIEVLGERQVDHGHKLDALKTTQDAIRDTQIDHGKRLGRMDSRLDGVESRLDGMQGQLTEITTMLRTALGTSEPPR